MPPRPIDLEPYKEWIIDEYRNHATVDSILDILNFVHLIPVRRRTLYRRLKDWAVPRHETRTKPTTELSDRLQTLYYEYGLSDEQLYQHLTRENYTLSLSGLITLRKSLEIFRRWPADVVNERQQQLRKYFNAENDLQGITRRLGLRSLVVHLRQRYYDLPRDAAFTVYREFHEKSIQERLVRLHRRRGGWTCPGPNYIMSVDAHLKLAEYGFEIYAGIDAFSRFISWFYVGFSALTARSVFAQYMHVVGKYEYLPLVIRSDRGKETLMMAAAHYLLSDASKKDRYPRQSYLQQAIAARNRGPNPETFPGNVPQAVAYNLLHEDAQDGVLPWHSCWSFGKSTQNQKIESWWNRLQEGRTLFWRVSTIHVYSSLCDVILTCTRIISARLKTLGFGYPTSLKTELL